MLGIDCLLKNTDIANDLKTLVSYMGLDRIRKGEDASFSKIYSDIRKSGIEVDAETIGKIYADQLSGLHPVLFTKMSDIDYATGSWFKKIIKGITQQSPKTGEKQIADLSPANAVVKAIGSAFENNVVADHTTKSILKTLEGIYRGWAQTKLGELPNPKVKDSRTTAEMVQQALDNEGLGYKNNATGAINGLREMHDAIRAKVQEMTQHMAATGDQQKIDQWSNYARALENAQYSLMFSSGEGKKVLFDAMRDGGYTKMTKNGKEVLDWQKMAGNINSYQQLRDNVVSSLSKAGFDDVTGNRVADALQEEFKDVRANIVDASDKQSQKIEDSWTAAGTGKQKETLPEMVSRTYNEWDNRKALKGDPTIPLKLFKRDAQRVVADALRNSDDYGVDFGKDRAIDWVKMAQERPTPAQLKATIEARLLDHGIDPVHAARTAESVSRDYHADLDADITANADRILTNREGAIGREVERKSDLHRLAELHDLGIFNGAHDKLLAHILGIEPSDAQAMADIKQYAEKLGKLRQLLSGNDFIVPSVIHGLNREIHSILAPVISNKTALMRRVSAINKIFQVDNSLLIATHGNILENHLSGLMETLTTNLSMRLKLGSDLGGIKGQDLQLMKDMYAHVSAGGSEFGLAPHQVGGMKERLTDQYTWHKMKGADWSKPKTWAKVMATAALTIPRTFLSGADSAVKIGLMNSHMKGGVVDAMVANGHSQQDAIQMYNDAIYGPGQLDAAKIKARDLYKKLGLNYVSERELNITANEMLRENLIQNKLITADELKEVMDNAYRQAGLGMGHESNNFMSKGIEARKRASSREEQKAIAENDYDKAAKIRLTNTIVNDVILRFASSRFNWAWIRAEQAGGGILTALYHYSVAGKKFKNSSVFDSAQMTEKAQEYAKARQKMARGVVGLGISVAGYLAAKAVAKALNPDEEDPTEKMFDDLKGNYGARALYLKVAPLWMLQSYEYNQIKTGEWWGKSIGALGEDFVNLTNVGDSHDFSVQLGEGIKNIALAKSDKQRNKGFAELGEAFNTFIPHVPLARQTKNVTQFVNWLRGGEPAPMPPYPDNFVKGLLYGGVIQDALGTFSDDQLPETFKGWGKKEEPAERTY